MKVARRVLLLVAALGATGVLVPTAASAAQMVGPGQLEELQSPPVTLHAPPDGRLRGYGFSAVVTGVGHGTALGNYVAGPGRVLWVFALELSTGGGDVDPSYSALAGQVVVGNRALDLDAQSLGSVGNATFALSAPAGVPITLELTADGYTQAFSLDRDRRLAPSPPVLYRDPSSYELHTSPQATLPLEATNPADGVTGAIAIDLRDLRLSFFDPINPSVHPADAADAYLDASFSDSSIQPPGQPFFGGCNPLPAQDLTLVLPDGTTVPATEAPNPSPSLLTGDYVFAVPGDLTAATLHFAPGAQSCAEFTPWGAGSPATIDFTPAQLPLSLPAPAPVAGLGAQAPSAPATKAASGSRRAPAGPWWIWPLVGAAIVVVVLLAGLAWRRRRPRTPHVSSRPALLAGPAPPHLPPALRPGGVERMKPAAPVIDVEPLAEPVTTVAAPPLRQERNADLVVYVVGPTEILGMARTRRLVLRDILLWFALNRRRTPSAAELAVELWPDDDFDEHKVSTLWSYMSRLRSLIPQGMLADATGGSGYGLVGEFEVDWEWIEQLLERARLAGGEEREALLAEALGLVRGEPLIDVRLEWNGLGALRARMEREIDAAALDLVRLRLARGDRRGAQEAALSGLRGVPLSWELHGEHLNASAGDPQAFARAKAMAGRALGDDGLERLLGERGLRP